MPDYRRIENEINSRLKKIDKSLKVYCMWNTVRGVFVEIKFPLKGNQELIRKLEAENWSYYTKRKIGNVFYQHMKYIVEGEKV